MVGGHAFRVENNAIERHGPHGHVLEETRGPDTLQHLPHDHDRSVVLHHAVTKSKHDLTDDLSAGTTRLSKRMGERGLFNGAPFIAEHPAGRCMLIIKALTTYIRNSNLSG
jgi:hypothetical protein